MARRRHTCVRFSVERLLRFFDKVRHCHKDALSLPGVRSAAITPVAAIFGCLLPRNNPRICTPLSGT